MEKERLKAKDFFNDLLHEHLLLQEEYQKVLVNSQKQSVSEAPVET